MTWQKQEKNVFKCNDSIELKRLPKMSPIQNVSKTLMLFDRNHSDFLQKKKNYNVSTSGWSDCDQTLPGTAGPKLLQIFGMSVAYSNLWKYPYRTRQNMINDMKEKISPLYFAHT